MVTSFLYGPLSKISELKEFGEKLLSIIKEFVPYLEKSIESYSNYSNNPFDYMESLANRPKIKIVSKPVLISNTPNPDDVIIKSSIMYHFQCSEQEAKQIMEESEK